MTSYTYSPKVTVKARGRGAGKTYEAARWLADKALNHPNTKIAAIARKSSKEFLIAHIIDAGNELGLSPTYVPMRKRVEFSNGAYVVLYDAESPDTFRGPEHDFLVGDDVQEWSDEAFFYARASCRPVNINRCQMLMNFAGTESERILELLGDGFEATTR